MEIIDGDIDYSSLTLPQLQDIASNIDAHNYPKNYANLLRAIAVCEKQLHQNPKTRSKYASFLQRLGAFLLDFLIVVPLIALHIWGEEQSRHFNMYYLVPGIIFNLWFNAYLVVRYGGTPGKLIMGIEIVKIDGTSVGYREAILRYSVMFFLGTLGQIAGLQAPMEMTDVEYFALDWQERAIRLRELAPSWLDSVMLLMNIWIWSEFIVMLTNRKRRAIHDFIAGTVVIKSH